MSSEEHNNWHEILAASTSATFTVILLLITVVHSYNVYSDLFTVERKSLKHRSHKPHPNNKYKQITYLTLFTLFMHLLSLFAVAIGDNFNKHCSLTPIFISRIGMFLGKCGLYLSYISRLHQLYGGSVYGYKKKTLQCFAVTVVIISLLLLIVSEGGMYIDVVYHDDTDNIYPHYCQIDYNGSIELILGSLIVLYDITASIMSIIAFILPIKKAIHESQKWNINAQTEKRHVKILYLGSKYKVLVLFASVFTILWILVYMAGQRSIGMVLYLADNILNPVCLLLMTPYYSNKYYETLCFVCICCCDPRKVSHKIVEELSDRTSTVQTSVYSDPSQTTKEEKQPSKDDVTTKEQKVDEIQ